MYYNFCRIHQTLRVTPAMAAGVTDHVWTLAEIVDFADTDRPSAVMRPGPSLGNDIVIVSNIRALRFGNISLLTVMDAPRVSGGLPPGMT